ncbi:MAG: Co2+/Mg2+ efflux protein ApaG [Bdellovibrionaceae bacterium]|nr:Co2+/Mg2+ efflux protein ApaG [Pseudobdellovibrionaceae bacterium]
MSKIKTTQPSFQISTKVVYIESESRPQQNYYFFTYKIHIKNTGNVPAQLLHRHWIITDAFGRIEEVKGPGVIGMQPKIQPGQSFEYDSACPLGTSCGSMKGFYQMLTDNGDEYPIEIPEFYLVCPESLH